jgi:hypothetical protein
MGAYILIEDNRGFSYSGRAGAGGYYRSDSKAFATKLTDVRLWEAISRVCQVSFTELTFIVPGDAVPDALDSVFPSWEAFYQSRFQAIEPLLRSLEAIILFIQTQGDWFVRF